MVLCNSKTPASTHLSVWAGPVPVNSRLPASGYFLGLKQNMLTPAYGFQNFYPGTMALEPPERLLVMRNRSLQIKTTILL